MGLDLRMVPVRLESAPVRAIRESAEAWDIASAQPPFFDYDEDDGPLPRISRELLEQIPRGFGLADPFPDRSHDQVEYLLDPLARRGLRSWEERERSLPYRTIRGDQYFAEHAKSGQGISWRYSASGFLAEAAARIDALDPPMLRRRFSVDEMVDAGVYKARRGEDDDETFGRCLAALRNLARYYHRLSENGLDLLVTLY